MHIFQFFLRPHCDPETSQVEISTGENIHKFGVLQDLARATPLPVPNLRQVLSVFVDILGVLY